MGGNLLIVEEDNLFRNNVAQRLSLENWQIYLTDQETEAKKILKRKSPKTKTSIKTRRVFLYQVQDSKNKYPGSSLIQHY